MFNSIVCAYDVSIICVTFYIKIVIDVALARLTNTYMLDKNLAAYICYCQLHVEKLIEINFIWNADGELCQENFIRFTYKNEMVFDSFGEKNTFIEIQSRELSQ